jgi:3-methyladenine DNA glycosylase AlkD
MNVEEILSTLKELGQESYKKVLLKHDIKEPLYGVKIEELQKIRKQIKNGHELALQLYDTGIYDAMYLAGLMVLPELMTTNQLQSWAERANAPVLREYTVAWVAAEGKHGITKAAEWIKSREEGIASTGWATLANIVAITADKDLDIPMLKNLLTYVAQNINSSRNRVKQAMNGYVIAVGIYVKELNELAKQTGQTIGKVVVDKGDTACKVPFSVEYIEKAEGKGAIGKKKKSARCL